MTKKERVESVLDGVIHPETGVGLLSGGMVASVEVGGPKGSGGPGESIDVMLKFRRARDPMAGGLRRQAEAALSAAFPGDEVSVDIATPEGSAEASTTGAATSTAAKAAIKPAAKPEPPRRLAGVKRVIAVASGKGGVGKSTVAANLAVALGRMGFRVGVLDADIYGPSQPELFGLGGYVPATNSDRADAEIVPAVSSLGGASVEIMSIGFFIAPSDALVWRGPMAVNALRQLIRQTAWGSGGELDFLLVDLPPGTGDIHLSMVHELELDGAVVVSTPQALALADVRRGVEMFRADGVGVPVLGVVENMAWFSPAESPDKQYFIFGVGGENGSVSHFAREMGIEFLGSIPLVMGEGVDNRNGAETQRDFEEMAGFYGPIARRIVDKLTK
jgi:ATP-binding protein involved in chromosome partitioning